jgi:16S rRNA (guanine966-N2)-methyltransferase
MRIIAGKLGGRLFASPKSAKTHPMSDKVRGALFNALGDLAGLSVLDPFAGSGALSFEAISRGAKTAVAIESDKTAQKIITENIRTLGLRNSIQQVSANTGAWIRTSPAATFDIILNDPPYDDLQPNLLIQLTEKIKSGGLFVLSWPGREPIPTYNDFTIAAQHNYGDAQLVFYRRIS